MVIMFFKRFFEWLFLVITFFFITLFLYEFFLIVNDWLLPIDEQKEPIGRSIKVISMEENGNLVSIYDVIERLKFYYWFGE